MAPLTFPQAMRNAIEAEYAASRFYQLLAESTHDSEARSFLEGMVAAEISHAHAIEQQAATLSIEGLPDRADSMVEVIETVPNWKFVDGISFDASLDIARTAEIQASLYYDAIADSLTGPCATFFHELARVEEQHAQLIEQRRLPIAVCNT
jgi:rubrerythrin